MSASLGPSESQPPVKGSAAILAEAALRSAVKGGADAAEAGELLDAGQATRSDEIELFPAGSSFVDEASQWFVQKFQLRLCGKRIGARTAKHVIVCLSVFVVVLFVFVIAVLLVDDESPPADGAVISMQSSQRPAVSCSPGEWTVQLFDDLHFSKLVDTFCKSFNSQNDFVSTCGNYKFNGCWCPGCRNCLSDCANFTAILSTTTHDFARAGFYRFFESSDDYAEYIVLGTSVFRSGCEWADGGCGENTFDILIDASEGADLSIRFAQYSMGAYIDLHWVYVGQGCADGIWREEVYGTESFAEFRAANCLDHSLPTNVPDGRHFLRTCRGTSGRDCGWCPEGLQRPDGAEELCSYFSVIFSNTVEFNSTGVWQFLQSSSGSASVSVDGIELKSMGCPRGIDGRCAQKSFAVNLAAGTHRIVIEFVELNSGDPFQDLEWHYVGKECPPGQWQVSLYNDVNFAEEAFRSITCDYLGDMARNQLLAQGGCSGVDSQLCWCPDGLSAGEDGGRCQSWSATLSADINIAHGGVYKFLGSSGGDMDIFVDGTQLQASGCTFVGDECSEVIYEAELAAGQHQTQIWLNKHDASEMYARLRWEHVGAGCAPSQWRVDVMHHTTTVSSMCDQTIGTRDGFLTAGGDAFGLYEPWCPPVLHGECDDFDALLTAEINFPETGQYRFYEKFRDSAVVFVDGRQLRSTGCSNPFEGRCSEKVFDVVLSQGRHLLTVELETHSGRALANLRWQFLGKGDCEWSSTPFQWYSEDGMLEWGGQSGPIGDDEFFTVDLPFPFPFYGGQKRSVRISSNGYLTFSGEHHGYGSTEPIPSTNVPNDLIAVYWTDLDPTAGGSIWTHGVSDEVFVVEWRDLPHFGSSDTHLCTFQCLLFSNGTVIMNYRSVPPSSNDHAPVTVGFENSDGTIGLQISHNNPTFPGDMTAIIIPDVCYIDNCAVNEWLVTVFSQSDFTNPAFVQCQKFHESGFFADLCRFSNTRLLVSIRSDWLRHGHIKSYSYWSQLWRQPNCGQSG
eukprot:SAG31_NODE_133_length_23315_cov_4.858847_8_plen_1016_part_00